MPTHTSIRGERFRAEFETVTIELERRFEYDINFLRDRFIYVAKSDGRRGYSAIGLGYGALEEHADEVEEDIRRLLPDMKRRAIDAALDLGYDADLRRAGDTINLQAKQVLDLCQEIALLRRPWWRKAYDRAGSWISGVR